MKVGFNILPLKTGHNVRGVGTYTRNILDQLKELSDIEIIEFEDINKINDVDLVYYPFFDLFQHSLPIKKKFPTVVMIHDVIPLIFPQYYPAGVRGSINLLLQKLSLKNVKAIITNSQTSKNDIAKYLNVPLEKIYPVYLSIGDNFKVIKTQETLEKIKEKYNLPDEFALYIGSTNWNKNLLNLAKACVQASTNLVLIGAGFSQRDNLDHPELRPLKFFLKEFEGNKLIKILGFIEEDDLVSIINISNMLLLPSFYEGFGLPILEAQACGVPVITSSVSSVPEVAGEGALLVNPEKIDEIEKAIKILTKDNLKREYLIKKGFENVSKFSWEKTADETIRVFKLALQEGSEK
ncbi:MAG: glycosyltransferase family 1 protein [Candidatus Daviesbacteria bacterium]|nr:glycosyltransferase family 1 protein [Candidatus Daviesbacteria bacterium]